MIKNTKILFSINPYRKYKPSNFNSKLSNYWQKQYEDMFKGWDK